MGSLRHKTIISSDPSDMWDMINGNTIDECLTFCNLCWEKHWKHDNFSVSVFIIDLVWMEYWHILHDGKALHAWHGQISDQLSPKEQSNSVHSFSNARHATGNVSIIAHGLWQLQKAGQPTQLFYAKLDGKAAKYTCSTQGPDSIQRCPLTSIEYATMAIRYLHNRISYTGNKMASL